jgi:hypothetical protein
LSVEAVTEDGEHLAVLWEHFGDKRPDAGSLGFPRESREQNRAKPQVAVGLVDLDSDLSSWSVNAAAGCVSDDPPGRVERRDADVIGSVGTCSPLGGLAKVAGNAKEPVST